jgi:hypothetical protein
MNDDLATENRVDDVERRDYVKPAVIHELRLETRAGTPTGVDPLVDPLGLDPNKTN